MCMLSNLHILNKLFIITLFVIVSNSLLANTNKEEAIYNARSTINEGINSVEIIRTDTGEQLYYESVPYIYKKPWDLSIDWQLAGFAPDSDNPVPEEVQVSWRKLPKKDQAIYRGDLVGPFRIKVRSEIPEDVLNKSRESGYDIALMFLVGKSPVTFCWRLGDYKSRPPSNFALQAGGSCLKDPYFANRDPNIGIKTQEEIDVITGVKLPVRENWSVEEIRDPEVLDVSYYIPETKSNFSKTLPKILEIDWKTKDGSVYGPYSLKVRSLIPDDILKLINNSYKHIVITINIDKKPPTVCWKLYNIKSRQKGKVKSQGGDCK